MELGPGPADTGGIWEWDRLRQKAEVSQACSWMQLLKPWSQASLQVEEVGGEISKTEASSLPSKQGSQPLGPRGRACLSEPQLPLGFVQPQKSVL